MQPRLKRWLPKVGLRSSSNGDLWVGVAKLRRATMCCSICGLDDHKWVYKCINEIIHICVWYCIYYIYNYDMICHMMSFAWCYSHSHTCLECLCIRQNWWTGLASWHVNKPTRSMSIDCSLLRDALSQPGRVTEAVLSLELGRSGSPLHSVLFSTCLAQPVRRSFCNVLRFSYRMYRAVEASAVRCPRMGCCAKLCIWKIGKQQTADDGFWSLPAWSFMTLIGGESHFSRVLTLGLFVFLPSQWRSVCIHPISEFIMDHDGEAQGMQL